MDHVNIVLEAAKILTNHNLIEHISKDTAIKQICYGKLVDALLSIATNHAEADAYEQVRFLRTQPCKAEPVAAIDDDWG